MKCVQIYNPGYKPARKSSVNKPKAIFMPLTKYPNSNDLRNSYEIKSTKCEYDVIQKRETKSEPQEMTLKEMHRILEESKRLSKTMIDEFHTAIPKCEKTQVGDLSDSKVRYSIIPNDIVTVPPDNVLAYIDAENDDPMIRMIHKLRQNTPIIRKPNVKVITRHLDKVCGMNEIETTNNWILSLLPNRQIRLEDNDNCFRLRLYKIPIFANEKVVAEGCLVPGGHYFRLTFEEHVSEETREAWLTITDRRQICNENVFNYMVTHPYGSLDSIRSKLCIAFVYDPELADETLKTTELYDCYYCQRRFYYKAVDKQFSGEMLIGKWGAREDIGAFFLLPEGASREGTDYLMAVASDVAWYRAWKATIYADFKDSENADFVATSIKKLKIKPLISDYLAVCHFPHRFGDKFIVAKFVFDFATRQLTTVNLESKKECFECHRIIAQPEGEEKDYDFRITGCDKKTHNVFDLTVRVVIPENHNIWMDALIIPPPRAFAFLELLLRELSDKKSTLCDIESIETSPHTFCELTQLIAILPKVQTLGTIFSRLMPTQLEHLALLTFEALYRPLISLKAAEKIANEEEHYCIIELCGEESARILQLVHRHICNFSKNTLKSRKQRHIWRKLVPYYMRLDTLRISNAEVLIERVAYFFDHAPYGCPGKFNTRSSNEH